MSQSRVSIIVTYYNFSGSELRMRALQRCLNSLPKNADVVLVVMGELPRVRRQVRLVEISMGAVLWQRERFWNVALDNVDPQCKTVAWIDADIVFPDDSWTLKLEDKLNRSVLVHLFSSIADVSFIGDRTVPTGDTRQSIVKSVLHPDKLLPDQYFSKSGVSLSLGCSPGFAWASRIELISSVRFPDFLILGSGDKAFLAAALGHQTKYAKALQLNSCLSSMYSLWAETIYERVAGLIGYIENDIQHIVQGAYEKRRYNDRYNLISSPDFVLTDLLQINEQGAWAWRDDRNQYAELISAYFGERND